LEKKNERNKKRDEYALNGKCTEEKFAKRRPMRSNASMESWEKRGRTRKGRTPGGREVIV